MLLKNSLITGVLLTLANCTNLLSRDGLLKLYNSKTCITSRTGSNNQAVLSFQDCTKTSDPSAWTFKNGKLCTAWNSNICLIPNRQNTELQLSVQSSNVKLNFVRGILTFTCEHCGKRCVQVDKIKQKFLIGACKCQGVKQLTDDIFKDHSGIYSKSSDKKCFDTNLKCESYNTKITRPCAQRLGTGPLHWKQIPKPTLAPTHQNKDKVCHFDNHNMAGCGYGDVHYKTYDGFRYDFNGMCDYTLTKLCKYYHSTETTPWFQVIAHQGNSRNDRPVSFLEGFTVMLTYGKYHVDKIITIKQNVKENNGWPMIKYGQGNFVDLKSQVWYKNERLLMSGCHTYDLYFGLDNEIKRNDPKNYYALKISWTVQEGGFLTLCVSPACEYKGKLCSLLGDYNDDKSNDFGGRKIIAYDDTPTKETFSAMMSFGNRYLYSEQKTCQKDQPWQGTPCTANDWQDFDKICNKLLISPWQLCNIFSNTNDLIASCKYDLCFAEKPKRDEVMCSFFSDRADECARNSLKIENWRTPNFCPIKCKIPNTIYKHDVSGCTLSAENCSKRKSSICKLPNITGCVCNDKFPIWDGSKCVAKCPPKPDTTLPTECFGTALGWGDVHYKTFDKLKMNFQGHCEYILTQLKDVKLNTVKTPYFKVSVRQDDRVKEGRNPKVTYTFGYKVKYYTKSFPKRAISVSFDIEKTSKKIMVSNKKFNGVATEKNNKKLRKLGMQVKGTTVYFGEPTRNLYKNPEKYFHIRINYNDYSISISLHCNYKGKVEGLLGNFDGKMENDKFMSNGEGLYSYIHKTYGKELSGWESSFVHGSSWLLNGMSCPADKKEMKTPPKISNNLINKAKGPELCGKLAKVPYIYCGINTLETIEDCAYDLSFTPIYKWRTTLCEILMGYKTNCRLIGKCVKDWAEEEVCKQVEKPSPKTPSPKTPSPIPKSSASPSGHSGHHHHTHGKHHHSPHGKHGHHHSSHDKSGHHHHSGSPHKSGKSPKSPKSAKSGKSGKSAKSAKSGKGKHSKG